MKTNSWSIQLLVNQVLSYITPYIHFLCPHNLLPGHGAAGAYPSCHWVRGRVHPGQVTSPSQGRRDKQPCTLTLTPRVNLESPINLTCMFFKEGGRKLQYLERIHTCMGRTCKHPKAPAGI